MYGASIHQRVNKDLELAFAAQYVRNVEPGADNPFQVPPTLTCFDLAAKYDWDDKIALRAKINSASQLALAITYAVKPGV